MENPHILSVSDNYCHRYKNARSAKRFDNCVGYILFRYSDFHMLLGKILFEATRRVALYALPVTRRALRIKINLIALCAFVIHFYRCAQMVTYWPLIIEGPIGDRCLHAVLRPRQPVAEPPTRCSQLSPLQRLTRHDFCTRRICSPSAEAAPSGPMASECKNRIPLFFTAISIAVTFIKLGRLWTGPVHM